MAAPFECRECGYTSCDIEDLKSVRDHDQRVMPGEIEPAGECPQCGGLIPVPDEDIEDHTVNRIAEIMRERGWTVIPPGRKQ